MATETNHIVTVTNTAVSMAKILGVSKEDLIKAIEENWDDIQPPSIDDAIECIGIREE